MIQHFVNAIKTTTKDAFTALGVGTVSSGVSFAKKEEDLTHDISGIISFAGDYVGVCMVRMSKNLAVTITNVMMGSQKTEIDSDVKDAIGEITNLVAGGARTKLNAEQYAFNISLPNVIVGAAHRTRVPLDLQVQVIPFFYADQKMSIEIGVKKKQ